MSLEGRWVARWGPGMNLIIKPFKVQANHIDNQINEHDETDLHEQVT